MEELIARLKQEQLEAQDRPFNPDNWWEDPHISKAQDQMTTAKLEGWLHYIASMVSEAPNVGHCTVEQTGFDEFTITITRPTVQDPPPPPEHAASEWSIRFDWLDHLLGRRGAYKVRQVHTRHLEPGAPFNFSMTFVSVADRHARHAGLSSTEYKIIDPSDWPEN